MTSNIDRAILVHLGKGRNPTPRWHDDRLIEEFGLDRGSELMVEVRSLLAEMNKFIVDWSHNSLASGTAQAREFMREQHPDLWDEALDALAWNFSWNWR